MIWAAMLLSVSSFSWYLTFAYKFSIYYTNLWYGLAGLAFISILPTLIGFISNRSLILSGPTVFQIARANFVRLLVYIGITVLGSTFIFDALTAVGIWKAWALVFIWQLISWVLGLYFIINSATMLPGCRSNIRSVEVSLVIFIPGFFLLTFMGLPSLLLIIIIGLWFISLALTLALEGTGSTENSVLRYGIVLFHTIVPPIAATILFFILFSGQFHDLLLAGKKAFLAFLNFILHLLELLFSKGLDSYYENPEIAKVPIQPEGGQMLVNPSLLFLLPFLVFMGILLLITLITGLAKLFKMRIKPVTSMPTGSFSFAKTVMQIIKWFFLFVKSIFVKTYDVFEWVKTLAVMLKQKVSYMLGNLLSPKTPYQKILRSYEAFLRLARRHGYPKKAYETPFEYADRLLKANGKRPLPADEIRRLTSLFVEARYSKRISNEQQAKDSQSILNAIRLRLNESH